MVEEPASRQGDNDGEQQVALEAFTEASRLISAARRHYRRGDFRRAASELAALPSVLAPLDEHIQRSWVGTVAARTAQAPGDAHMGAYL